MRASGTHRLLLNAKIFAAMQVARQDSKHLKLCCVDHETQKVAPFLVTVGLQKIVMLLGADVQVELLDAAGDHRREGEAAQLERQLKRDGHAAQEAARRGRREGGAGQERAEEERGGRRRFDQVIHLIL